MDTARSEAVEADLDRFIQTRHDRRVQDEGERAVEETWRESVRAYEEKRRQVARLEWHRFHCGQAERHRRTLEGLIARHEGEAAKLMEARPKGVA